jgi:hypothetical protein
VGGGEQIQNRVNVEPNKSYPEIPTFHIRRQMCTLHDMGERANEAEFLVVCTLMLGAVLREDAGWGYKRLPYLPAQHMYVGQHLESTTAVCIYLVDDVLGVALQL